MLCVAFGQWTMFELESMKQVRGAHSLNAPNKVSMAITLICKVNTFRLKEREGALGYSEFPLLAKQDHFLL